MSKLNNKITVKITEKRISGIIGDSEVIVFKFSSDPDESYWHTSESAGLPSDIDMVSIYIECFSQAREALNKKIESES